MIRDLPDTSTSKVAKELLKRLKAERLVLDWREKEQARSAVRQSIAVELDKLPDAYTKDIYDQKCELTYQFVFEHYPGPPGGLGEGAQLLQLCNRALWVDGGGHAASPSPAGSAMARRGWPSQS